MSHRRNDGFINIVLAIVAIVIIGFLAWLWMDSSNNTESVSDAVNDAQSSVNETVDNNVNDNDDLLSKIVNTPENYYGQTVTVGGEIQDLYNRRVFTISDQTAGGELLVITRTALTASQAEEAEELFEDNADVTVTGTVIKGSVSDIESAFSIDIPAELESRFTDKPIVYANSMTFSDTNAVFDFTQGPDPGE